MSTIYINILCALVTVMSNTLIKYSLSDKLVWKGELITFLFDLISNFRNPLLILALIIFITGNILWIFVITTQNFSFALPFQIALVFLINIAISYFIFNEKFTFHYVVGLVFIIIGIILISIANVSSND
jgi:drug/metabolite transporter (DMT)-like permease